MEILKSHVSVDYYAEVVSEKIRDLYSHLTRLGSPYIRKSDLISDIQYVRSRASHEGIRLFTTSLPLLGEEFDSLMCGRRANTGMPRFLRPCWILMSDLRKKIDQWSPGLGTELPVSADDVLFIKMVRSILFGYKKLELTPTQEQMNEKIEAFLANESSLETLQLDPLCNPVLHRAQIIMDDYMEGYTHDKFVYTPTCDIPKHGPGAVADRKKFNEKWNFSTLYESLHQQWPYYEFQFGTIRGSGEPQWHVHLTSNEATRNIPSLLLENVKWYRALKRAPSPVSRLVFVPKDSRGPRVISCEPSELMWMQQGVYTGLVHYIEQHPWTKGHVNFADQSINAQSALQGARDNSLATIDLKDASDRVSVDLVKYLLPGRVFKKLAALRSTHTILPNGQTIELCKFAAMGSALCFPVEAIVFWSLCVAALETQMVFDEAAASVYVYGDDIIVPTAYAQVVIDALQSVGLTVNTNKCFYGNEFFRESCGIDSFCGYDVTPFRQKTPFPSRSSDGGAIAGILELASNSRQLFPRTSGWMIRYIEDLVNQPIPRCADKQAFLHILTAPNEAWTLRDYLKAFNVSWDRHRCCFTFSGLTLRSKGGQSPFENSWSRLLSDLTVPQETEPTEVVDRASTKIRKKKVYLQLPWSSKELTQR